jgi:hypothetical protein
MGTPKHNNRKATKSTVPCSDLLEVWLGLLEKIEGPRRRAGACRHHQGNPKRRTPYRNARRGGA